MGGGGIKYNGNFTSVIFPTQQEVSRIYGQFMEILFMKLLPKQDYTPQALQTRTNNWFRSWYN